MRKNKIAWLFLLPSIVFLVVVVIFPMLYSLRLAFHSWNLAKPESGTQFIWLQNFQRLLCKDTDFHRSLQLTFIFSGIVTTIEFLIGLGLAYALHRQGRAEKIFTSMFMIPPIVAPVVVALQWKFLLDLQYGLVNWLLSYLGIMKHPIGWLSQEPWALYSVMIVDIWHWTPLMYLILLAGCQSLPKEPFDAARVDGASSWKMFLHLYLPMLKPIILIALLIRSLCALIFFEEVLILTRGGPGSFTEVASWYLYKVAFRFWEMGYASAGSWLFLVLVVAFYEIFVYVMSKEE